MTSRTACRRQTRRYSLVGNKKAWIELDFPSPTGRRYRFSLLDVSISGFSFHVAEPLDGLEEGTKLAPVKLTLGDCEIRGELLVMHVTSEPESGIVCGALFYPANDEELLKLKGVIAGIDTAQSI